jgi:hypothetical protein
MSESRAVRLPADLCSAAEQKFGSNFGSLDELVIFLLQELLTSDSSDLDQAELEVVEERLRDLGYV